MSNRGSLKKIHDDITYFPHQLEGVRTLSGWPSFILADEMGLGKSLQALTVAAVDFETGKAESILVVCPASIKGNWGDEIEEHSTFTYEILDGTPKQRAATLAAFDKDILIVNYEQVMSHVDELNSMGARRRGALGPSRGRGFDIVIYDEAQYMKSRTSKRTKATMGLKAARHMVLTGSPMLNQVNDLWALLHRVAPGEFPSYWTFVNRYAVFGGYMDKQIIGVKNERELNERLQFFMLRRLKADVLDLPPKQHIPIKLDMHPEQRKLYKQAVEEMKIDNPSGLDPMEIENALTKFLRLKQICGTTATIPGHDDHSSKLDRAVEMIQEIIDNGKPVVVFTQFRGVLQALQARLLAAGIDWRTLHGDVPIPDRQPVVRAWTEDASRGKPQALICMIQVAGVGLTMTAASTCIFLDKLFVPKLNEQAEDRLHRIGAKDTVTIYDLQMRNSIEQRIEKIIKTKNTIFGAVIDTDNSSWKQKLIAAIMEDEDE